MGHKFGIFFLFQFVQLNLVAQHDLYLSAGLSLQRNKPFAGKENNRYEMPSYSLGYKTAMTFDLTNRIYVSLPVYFYQQQINQQILIEHDGGTYNTNHGLEDADYSIERINKKSNYNFIGFGLMPGFSFGKHVRFFASGGYLVEYSFIRPIQNTYKWEYYKYDSDKSLMLVYETEGATQAEGTKSGGEDRWWIVQGGVHFNMNAKCSLQPSICYRVTARGMNSFQVPVNERKYDVGASVMFMYRFGNKRRNVRG